MYRDGHVRETFPLLPREATRFNAFYAEEMDRIELQLGGAGYTGYTRVGGQLGPLPIGSHLDEATGTFTWGAGAGFVGDYDLVFVPWSNGRAVERSEVRIRLAPKQRYPVGPQVR